MANVKNQTVMFVGVAKKFSGKNSEPDKNGKSPWVLDPYCGKSPRTLNVISGTVAEGQGFVEGERFEIKAVHMGQAPSTVNPEKTVESFNFSNMGKISSAEAREWRKEEPISYLIAPEEDEEYQAIGASANAQGADPTEVRNKI